MILEFRSSSKSTGSITSKWRTTRWSNGPRIFPSKNNQLLFEINLNFVSHFRIHRFDRRHQLTRLRSNLHILNPALQLTIRWCRINHLWDRGAIQEAVLVDPEVWECHREWEMTSTDRQDNHLCRTIWIHHVKVSPLFKSNHVSSSKRVELKVEIPLA